MEQYTQHWERLRCLLKYLQSHDIREKMIDIFFLFNLIYQFVNFLFFRIDIKKMVNTECE
jgi:hypothetical protein